MTRKLLLAALAALCLAAPARAAGPVTVAAPWEIAGFDPAVSGFAFQRMQVAETLVDADATGRLRPGLATGWTASPDGLTWRLTLREGVRFHDGALLTAEAAAAALKRALANPGVLKGAPIVGIAAEGGEVVIALEAPFAALPALLAHATTLILSPGSYAADGGVVAAHGTGPYRVAEIAPPQSMRLVAFDGYWGDRPAIGEARYLAAGRAETRALMAESGDAQLVFTLDPAGFARLATVEGVETRAEPIPRVLALKLNAAHPVLADPRARRASNHAGGPAGIAAGLLRAPETAATQLFPPALGDWHVEGLAPLAHDPAEASRLLAELGWTPGPDGVLARDGARFALTLRTFPDRPELPLVAAALQDQWRAIGVELAVSVGNFSEIPAGHQDGSLELGLYARNYGLTPDPIGTVLQDFGDGGGDWGAMGWARPDVAAALAAIARDADPAARAPRIATVAAALQEDLPVIPVVWYRHTLAVDRRLESVVVDPLERSYGIAAMRWRE